MRDYYLFAGADAVLPHGTSKTLTPQTITGAEIHSEDDCTFSIISNADGAKSLPLDTYESKTRKIPGKKNQSLRFDNDALAAIKKIISDNHL